jgi:hypothetical protein
MKDGEAIGFARRCRTLMPFSAGIVPVASRRR